MENTNGVWVCNECNAPNYTGSVSEDDLNWLACISCGCDEFHFVTKSIKDETLLKS